MIYVMVEGERHGPFTLDELSELWKAGEIDPADARYWYRGMPAWAPVVEFKPPQAGARTPASAIRFTTANAIGGRAIETEIEIISAECIFKMDLLDSVLSNVSDLFGGRSQKTQEAFQRARRICLGELRREAHTLGADAVVAVDLNYSEIKGMLFLVGSGTAVLLDPPAAPR